MNIARNIITSTLLFGIFQIPFLHDIQLIPVTTDPTTIAAAQVLDVPISKIFLGEGMSTSSASLLIGKQIDLITTRSAYQNSLSVIKKHADTIRQTARELGVPEDVAIGVALLENGGSETAVSKAGALGVFQLMPGTARAMGLTVNKKVDERKDPALNIRAGITYLKDNYDRFGDWGLATWAYHAGEGNVTKALQLYARANSGIKLPGLQDAGKLRAYVEEYNVTIHQLLSSSAVATLTRKLSDDSAGYPYKVLATAFLFRNAGNSAELSFGQVL